MQIEYSKKFIKEFKKCSSKIKTAFKNKLKTFIKDQFNPTLNNHSLTGKLKNTEVLILMGIGELSFKKLKMVM